MINFQTSNVEVKRPVAEVFAYLSDLDRQPEWSSAVQQSHIEGSGEVDKGTRYTQTVKLLGKRIEGRFEVTDCQPNRRIEFTTLSGPMPMCWDAELTESGDVTQVIFHGRGEPGGLFKLAEPVMRRAMQRQAEHDLANLKDILEGR